MRKTVITLLCLFTVIYWCPAGAQNTVESIRQRYTEMKEYVATHTKDNQWDGAYYGEYYHLQAHQWLPGTGGHMEDTYLYWGEVESDDEDVIFKPHYVKFVTKKYNYAARNYYEEFLYDPDGNVAFIYAYDPMTQYDDDANDMQYEFRFYLDKGRLIYTIVKRKGYDEAEYQQVWAGDKPNAQYQSKCDAYINIARTMRELFINIEKEAY